MSCKLGKIERTSRLAYDMTFGLITQAVDAWPGRDGYIWWD